MRWTWPTYSPVSSSRPLHHRTGQHQRTATPQNALQVVPRKPLEAEARSTEAALRETGTIRLRREAMKYRHPRMELGHAVRLAASLPDRTWIVSNECWCCTWGSRGRMAPLRTPATQISLPVSWVSGRQLRQERHVNVVALRILPIQEDGDVLARHVFGRIEPDVAAVEDMNLRCRRVQPLRRDAVR